NAALNQTGGTINVGTPAFHKWAFIGNAGGATGTYNLSAGTLNSAERIYVGNNGGVGTLNQTGGQAIAADQFIVNSASTVNLSGGTISSGADMILNSGGTFNLN